MRLGLRIVAVALATARVASARCDEADGCLCHDDRSTCVFVDDGECDDGSDSSECFLGYDCTDCGNRRDGVGGNFLCKNRCGANTRDGVCDDGGPGSRAARCDFGHDCDDCGTRQTEDACINNQMEMCHDTRSGMFACSFIRDGVCDDGGEGSSFHRCSLGTDCEDCNGPRTQACGPGVEYEPTHSYSYGDTTGGDDATAVCVGDPGVPMCDAAQCQEWKRPNCFSCMCMSCDFCAGALESITSPPPPHPQPPPPDAFSCDMLTDRDDLRRDSSDAQCYSVVRDAAKCARSYTYDAFAEDGPDLRLCLARSDGMCESWPIDPSLFESDYCQSKLWFPPPPPPPPSPPPSPNPPPPPSMPPPSPPPSPPSPPPCLPRSAKCGGHGWTGLTNCCMEGGPFAYTSCIKQNEYRSQCRDDCPPDWDCQHLPHYGMSQFAWGMYTMSGGATPTPSPEPEVDAGQGTVTDVEQELESPPPSPPPPGAANHQQPATPTPSKGSGVDSSKADGSTSPSAAPQHSSSGLVAGLVIAALFVVCFGLLCRRWAQRGAQMRKGNRLHDETVAEAGEWAQEEPGLEMPMVDDEPAATRL